MTLSALGTYRKKTNRGEWHHRQVALFRNKLTLIMSQDTFPRLIEDTTLFGLRNFFLSRMKNQKVYISPYVSVFYSGEPLDEVDKYVIKALLSKDKTKEYQELVISFNELVWATRTKNWDVVSCSLDRLCSSEMSIVLSHPKNKDSENCTLFKYRFSFLAECIEDPSNKVVTFAIDPMLHELFD